VNDYVISVLKGIIEGLTEFLPVSSTAHLRLANVLLHKDLSSDYWKMYDIVIQLGAILALPVFFWGRITKFLRTFPKGERGNRNLLNHPLSLVMVAFVVTAIPAYLLKKKIGENLENLHVIGAALLIGGVVMWGVDALFTRPSTLHVEEMGLLQAIWIGAVQILSAVFPGTSRSMATIAAGQVSGMSRPSALEFSFFLSIPTMIAATGFELLHALLGTHDKKTGEHIAPLHVSGDQWIIIAIGFVVSFIVALAVVAWFMHWVRRRGFTPFAIYRIFLGMAVLLYARKHG
jgi:undecaprenyl-diphosphatase